MKNQLNLTVANVRKLLLVTALVICPLLLANTGFAQNMGFATLSQGGMTTITIGQNDPFTLTLAGTTNFDVSAYTVYYQVSPNGMGFFQALARVNNNAFLTDNITTDAQAFGADSGVLKFQGSPATPSPGTSNRYDLGYVFGSQNQPAGSFGLQTITFTSLNAPVGTYTIFLDSRSIFATADFQDFNIGGPNGPQVTINVIPEPATVGLAVIGGALLLLVAVRKHRARA